jgi:hypothetical protein
MSTEPYPEVNVDESGIEPRQPQHQHGPEWPKKIRTLTATELDRLTIDGSGRFYWDGKLVNYEPPGAAKLSNNDSNEKSEQPSRKANLLDDPYSFETKSSEHDQSGETDRSDDAPIHPVAHREDRFHDLEDVRTVSHRAVHQRVDDALAGVRRRHRGAVPDGRRAGACGLRPHRGPRLGLPGGPDPV